MQASAQIVFLPMNFGSLENNLEQWSRKENYAQFVWLISLGKMQKKIMEKKNWIEEFLQQVFAIRRKKETYKIGVTIV